MGKCATCGRTILFGGKKLKDLLFCSDKCLGKGPLVYAASDISDLEVEQRAIEIHHGACPLCGKEGRVIDVHRSHTIVSYVLYTEWETLEHVCCRSCARKKQVLHLLVCSLLGWWGFPWGILITPLQILKNIKGLLTTPDPRTPSDALKWQTRLLLAQKRFDDINNN